eukprot:scaffold539_cov187-Ochromonas_danica.AAC.4
MTLWQLPRDVLHYVYIDWLEWEDLSGLDIACTGKTDRDLWLSSLTDLWIPTGRRKIYLREGFDVILTALHNVVEGIDVKSYCPALRSVKIEIGKTAQFSNHRVFSQFETNLSTFFGHCHSLQEIVMFSDDLHIPSLGKHLSEMLLEALNETLRENSLTKISFLGSNYCHASLVMIARLLTKHASSLQLLSLTVQDGIELITSALINNKTHVRKLEVFIKKEPSQRMDSWLLPYLSSAGDSLETLEVLKPFFGVSVKPQEFDYLLDMIAALCPKLTRLIITNAKPCNAKNLRLLFEQCPHLQDVCIDGTIMTNEEKKTVSFEVRGSDGDWAACLCHALTRNQFKVATLKLKEVYHPMTDLKSMLEPYQISLEASTGETSLITILHDLPHLNRLCLELSLPNDGTDATLAAIETHAKSLTELEVPIRSLRMLDFAFTDKSLSKLIEACQLLKVLIGVTYCGLESIVAVSKHSSLRKVVLTVGNSVSKEMLNEFLLDKNLKWPSSLEEGVICLPSRGLKYIFKKASHCWTL